MPGPSAAPDRPLAIGLNLTFLIEGSGGAGRYARELMRSLVTVEPESRVTAFVNSEAPEDLFTQPWSDAIDWVRLPVRLSEGPPGNFVLTMGAQWGAIPVIARRRGIDVIHGLANIAPPVAPGIAVVVTLLDLIWMRDKRTMEARARIPMRILAPLCARSADRVIAISGAARDDLVATLKLPPGKIDVTHLGVRSENGATPLAAESVRERFGLGPEPIVLCVAQKRSHKNLATLVSMLARLRDVPAQLVIPGAPTPYEEELRSLAAELGVASRAHFPGWVSEEELEGLYAAAACFVLPSLEEGFGLPILEAMSRGIPVACSNRSSLPEVAGDAAVLFDPLDPAAVADAVGRLLADAELRSTLAERGLRRAAEFTWERTAEATLASYRAAIASRS